MQIGGILFTRHAKYKLMCYRWPYIVVFVFYFFVFECTYYMVIGIGINKKELWRIGRMSLITHRSLEIRSRETAAQDPQDIYLLIEAEHGWTLYSCPSTHQKRG